MSNNTIRTEAATYPASSVPAQVGLCTDPANSHVRGNFDHLPPLMSAADLAPEIGFTIQRLAQDRTVPGKGIPFVRYGRSIRYRRVDVESFFAARVRTATQDEPVAA